MQVLREKIAKVSQTQKTFNLLCDRFLELKIAVFFKNLREKMREFFYLKSLANKEHLRCVCEKKITQKLSVLTGVFYCLSCVFLRLKARKYS